MTNNRPSANGKIPPTNGNSKLAATLAATSQFQFLKPIKFQKVSFWDFSSNSVQQDLAKHKYKLVRFSDLIKQRKGFFTIDDEKEYKRCKVQLYSRGVVLRDIVKGKEIQTKKQQICKTDDFLVAEIDAKVGGYGIVPSELEDAIVSSHYYLYEIDKTKLLPGFLGLYLKTDEFAKQVQPSGSTNYASIRAYQVLEYQVPLPPIDSEDSSVITQKKLVADYQNKISQAEKFKTKAEKLEKEIENYLLDELGIEIIQPEKKAGLQVANFKELERWDFDYLDKNQFDIFSSLKKSKFPIQYLGDTFSFVNRSWNKRNYSEKYFDYIEIGAIDNLVGITKAEKLRTSAAPSRATQTVKENDLILGLTRPNLKRFAIVNSNYDGFVCSSGFQVIEKSEEYNLEFLLEFLKSEAGVKQFELFMTGALYPAITSKQLKAMRIPLPSLKIQNRIVKHIDSLKAKIKKLKSDEENLRRRAKDDFESELFEL